MARYGMTVDTRLCVGCNDCVAACQAENEVPAGRWRNWIATEVRGSFPNVRVEYRSERCNHCENAPCVTACPTGASHVSDLGGIVMVDHDRCIGCKACMVACPYGARYVHPDGYADKCTFCAHRVKEGKDPACVAVCPMKALSFGDLDDARSTVSWQLAHRRWHVLLPDAGTRPRVFFLT